MLRQNMCTAKTKNEEIKRVLEMLFIGFLSPFKLERRKERREKTEKRGKRKRKKIP